MIITDYLLQIPLEEQRTDAVNNLLGALIFASHYVIPEVPVIALWAKYIMD